MRKPAIHGRDHGLWSSDPIRVGLSPSASMGAVLPGLRLPDISFGLNGGILYIPSREGDPVETGDKIRSSFAFAEPGPGHFDWIASRVHIVDGLSADTFHPVEPWEASPWSGGVNLQLFTGADGDLSPLGGNWNGSFYGFAGVSSDDSDVVHFQTPGLEIDDDEQFGWDVAGVGHIGYLFHDFTASETGDITISFASGSGPTKSIGYIRCTRTGSVTVGAMAGQQTGTQTAQSEITLTDDVPEGSGLILVTATQATAGFWPSDATARPVVDISSREQASNLVPSYRVGSQVYPIVRDIGGIGQAGGAIDGGSP